MIRWGLLLCIAWLLASVAMPSRADTATRGQLPTLALLSGQWVGMDASGAVCRLVLDGQGRGAVACLRYKTPIVVATVREVEFDKHKVRLDLDGATPDSEKRLVGTASDVMLSLRFQPSGKRVNFYREDRVSEDFQEAREVSRSILPSKH